MTSVRDTTSGSLLSQGRPKAAIAGAVDFLLDRHLQLILGRRVARVKQSSGPSRSEAAVAGARFVG
jgi:hypothetical protein